MNRLWQWNGVGALTVQMGRTVLTRLWSWARKGADAELGAFLIGTVHDRADGGFRVVVTEFLPVENVGAVRNEFTFRAEAFNRIHQDYPIPAGDLPVGLTCVGWVHTHPGQGVHFSDTDIDTHHKRFNWPFQVGLVIDPRSSSARFFHWERPGKLCEVRPDDDESMFDPATGLFGQAAWPNASEHPEPLRWVFGLATGLAIVGVLLSGLGVSLRPQPLDAQRIRLFPPDGQRAFRWLVPSQSTTWVYAITPAGTEPPAMRDTLNAQSGGSQGVMIQLRYDDVLAWHLTGPTWLWIQGDREKTPRHIDVPEILANRPYASVVIPLGGGRYALREPDEPRAPDRVVQVVPEGEAP